MGRPVGISSNGEEGDGTGQRAPGPGRHLGELSGSQQEAVVLHGGPQAVPSQEGRLASLPWGQSLGRASLPLAAGTLRGGLPAELATPQPSRWGKGSFHPEKGDQGSPHGTHCRGAPSRGRGSSLFGSGIGAGFGPGVLCIRILPFWRRAGWFGQKMLALLCALG